MYVCMVAGAAVMLHLFSCLGFCFSRAQRKDKKDVAFTRYCYYQYSMVYSIQTGDRKGSRILSNDCAIVLYQGGQCRWAGG